MLCMQMLHMVLTCVVALGAGAVHADAAYGVEVCGC